MTEDKYDGNDNDNDKLKEDNDKPVELVEFFRFSLMRKVTELLTDGMMSTADFTNWNIFKLHDICRQHTLLICANYLFLQLDLYKKLSISQDKLLLFLHKIESGYLDIPYHSSLHATDVMINSFHFLIKSNLIISDLDKLIILLSAACHDYKHPGFNSAFLLETNHEIAIKYKEKTPLLEYMHSNESLQVLADRKWNGFLQNFTKLETKYIAENMNDMILGTAPESHQSHIARLDYLHTICDPNDVINGHKKDVMNIALHCADIGSVCKSYDIFVRWWVINILSEWLMQGDKEKELNLSKTWKMMDRDHMDKIPEWLYEFIESLFVPLLQKWTLLFPKHKQFAIWYSQLVDNNKKLKDQGFGDHFECFV